jgi:hypothetical protein
MIRQCQTCKVEVFLGPDECPECKGPLVNFNTPAPDYLAAAAARLATPEGPEAISPYGHLFYEPPRTVDEIFASQPSPAGHSAVSTYLACPENSRLRSLNVVRKINPENEGIVFELDALGYGTLIHGLLGERVVRGYRASMALLDAFVGLHPEDHLRARALVTAYDSVFPLDKDPFEYLGVEVQVATDIGDGRGGSLIRTVRYDTIVRFPGENRVFSLENKTSASRSEHALKSYAPQFWVQQALWNSNPACVATWGPMEGVIGNVLVKTKVPDAYRTFPYVATNLQMTRALEYLRMPAYIPMPAQADGSYPRFLHTCWSRWGPCRFVDLCHEGLHNLFEVRVPPQRDVPAQAPPQIASLHAI